MPTSGGGQWLSSSQASGGRGPDEPAGTACRECPEGAYPTPLLHRVMGIFDSPHPVLRMAPELLALIPQVCKC